MEQLTVTRKEGADYILFELNGAFNAYTAPNIQNKIYKEIETHNVVLDLNQVIQLDSAAVGVIMASHNDAEENHTKLYLMKLSNEAEKAITATGFRDLFRIINSVTEVA